MRVIVIDDEKAMHLIMSKMLGKLADVEVAGCFFDTASASRCIDEHEVHAAFVDISMPQESGMQFAERMAMAHPDLYIIFVTSHKDYALDAFELSALDYIVKPVSPERIEKAVMRARAVHSFAEAERTEPKTDRVRIDVLGGLEVSTAYGSVKWISRKSAELFGYLLIHPGRIVSRARILYDVFGDMASKNADTYLNTSIYQLRKALAPHGLKSMVLSDSEGYGLDLTDASIDYAEFEERIHQQAEWAADDLDKAMEIEKLYAGELFGEKGFGWAMNDTERLSALYAAFAKRLAAALLEHREEDTAVQLLNKLFDRNELDEETASLLLRAYAAKKDRASLAKLYRRYVKVLHQELHLDPSKELIELYTRLQTT
ncbi:response regulator [Cohnella lubricantis]|uniref:Response regulator n=1 Tax=Cohnella lubricantis TaxID=2163172 RepID=A0A841TA55_9BACL|nr:response regulator [Cohnella lubricantis]MBB6675917.1 response regulator [Cohnella lubricantis]MBP2117166.1 two-component SAPR family response regulator [Cohnella lubricantis]